MARKTDNAKDATSPGHGRFVRYCLFLLVAGLLTLTWLSVLTYEANDLGQWQIAPDEPTHNAAGIVGAHVAHTLLRYLGGGVYMGLLFVTIALGGLVFGMKMGELPWRIAGACLLVAGTSTAICLVNPDGATDIDHSGAGVLGAATGDVLVAKTQIYGAWVIVGFALLTGLLLTADNLVRQAPGVAARVLGRLGSLRGLLAALRRLPGALSDRLPRFERKPKEPKAPKAPKVKSKPAKPVPSAPVAGPRPDDDPVDEPAPAAGPGQGGVALPQFRLTEPTPARKTTTSKPKAAKRQHPLPAIDLLAEPEGGYSESQAATAAAKQHVLQQTLTNFNVDAQVVGHQTGPVITMYELSLAPGVKVSQVGGLAVDIARSLAVPGVRIVSPIPGKDTIGIEVPNLEKEMVRIRELMNLAPEAEQNQFLPLYLGKDAGGDAIVADLARMPHMLIAGTTGSGKSVCINTIIMSLLMTRTPDEVKFILVDPKMVEMAAFENLSHLLCPIVNDMRKAEDILQWAATKMDERYELLKEAAVRNVAGYNRLDEAELYERFQVESDEEKARIPKRLPYYVIIIDELADLMMTSSKEVENHIIRIAQKARAVGIHLVLATQRPSVNVVTGLIKSNMPCRISFRVASRQESRIVLDQNGADVLLGQGDMLFLQPGTSNLIRAQGTFVDDGEIRNVTKELRSNGGEPEYNPELVRLQSAAPGETAGEKDELFDQAVEIVLASRRGSVSLLQRRLQIGYSRASRIIDQMAEAGMLGEYKGSQARECLLTLEDWHAMQASIEADQSGASSYNGEATSA
jgi:S-DNA-T family DNA segregation ATPase FtsK/SpoIIIE